MEIICINNRREKEHTMRNNGMTGPIILSGGDHAQFRQDVLNPTFELMNWRKDLDFPQIALNCKGQKEWLKKTQW